jgi:hypothetical protein
MACFFVTDRNARAVSIDGKSGQLRPVHEETSEISRENALSFFRLVIKKKAWAPAGTMGRVLHWGALHFRN